jgi:predicted transcriptional regulator
MGTVNVRLPEELRDTLKIIATVERRDMKDILSELVDNYIERHRETLEILSNPKWVELIKQGKREVEAGVKGKKLRELED